MNHAYEERFLAARRKYIESQFADLNPMQRTAALTTEGPLLLLAGAGSGKTTVLINRIANLIRFGSGYESNAIPWNATEEDVEFLETLKPILSAPERERADALCREKAPAPWQIMAITFTNKAANELKERLSNMLGESGMEVWAMTFHAACCRILRRDIELLGYTRSFTIYDTADSERVMKDIVKDMGLDDKTFPAKMVLSVISRQKDRMISPEECAQQAKEQSDVRMTQIAKCYRRYQTQLMENNALDFDDIIYLTVRLLQEHEEVRAYYQKRFRYVLVDEYQDTNNMQYLLTSLLAGGWENLCVVGDDDQSIYRFRGATIENILNFENQYKGARTIRLEQNYRSTEAILNAANAVIAHNHGRKGKTLWTSNGAGEPVTVYTASDGTEEANYVSARILALSRGRDFKKCAVLYRTNAQSNAIEYSFKRNGIPYRIIGGTRFFDRAEVKDMLAYLTVIHNRADDLRLKRIINTPARGLGAKAVETAERLARAEGKSLYAVIEKPQDYAPLEKPAGKMRAFVEMIESLAELQDSGIGLCDFYEEVMHRTGYIDMLKAKPTEENQTRLENVRELKSSINSYVENADSPSLAGFLEEIALYTDIEQYDAGADAAVMMTIHSAKGLEFDHVFLVGFEDGLFPGVRSIGDPEEMEEERRLCYVAITRARKTLDICHARMRMLYGQTRPYMASRFLKEIPEEVVQHKGGTRVQAERPSYGTQSMSPQSAARREAIKKSQKSSLTAAPAAAPAMLELSKGDMVQHKAFGKGMVLTATPVGGDTLLEIAFDEIGTKRMFAKTASVHMKKL
ncbi:MAG: ATP-dependent DNA helicase PcrA [Ruminococcaceae bacterium]|nr:ATP-dependent DNA helicase PcrA [Oscillospiraceae bacterium]